MVILIKRFIPKIVRTKKKVLKKGLIVLGGWAALGFEFRAYNLSHSASPFL
jgi:hypothetical protein